MPADERLIVGRETGDDAAVFRLGPDLGIAYTVDALTPVHDDPFTFGQIAAANSLSDIWAMGGTPTLALNVCGFPQSELPMEILAEILKGGMSKAAEAGVIVPGGHTMNNDEPFYGMAVVGLINPDRIISNAGARPGNQLVLTKPLGTGVVVTAMMNEETTEEHVATLTASMTALNQAASEVMLRHGVTAATDVTGFGLVGHAHQMARASRVTFRFHLKRIPLLPGALEYAAAGNVTKASGENRAFTEAFVDFGEAPEELVDLLCDPQTSGGLLIALPAVDLEEALEEMRQRGVAAAHVGEVVEGSAGGLIFAG